MKLANIPGGTPIGVRTFIRGHEEASRHEKVEDHDDMIPFKQEHWPSLAITQLYRCTS